MSASASGIHQLGTQALPIALGAMGGATDVGTWTHSLGKKALKVEIVDNVNGAEVLAASVVVTQPDTNSIVLTNTTAGVLNVVAIVTFEIGTPENSGVTPATSVVLS